MLSVHTCPMAQPGMRSAGGMNVYLKELAQTLAAAGICVDIFTRSHQANGPVQVSLGPRARVVHIPAGPPELPKESIYGELPRFLEGVQRFQESEGYGYDILHSHYWLSGWVGVRLARSWRVPHIATFHTLALEKRWAAPTEEEPPERESTEMHVASSAEWIVVSTPDERESLVQQYGASPDRVQVVPGGVDLERFRPQEQAAVRPRLGLDPRERVVLYVGRVEPFKGTEVLLRAMAQVRSPEDIQLVIVGGGGDEDPEVARLQRLSVELGIQSRVRWQSATPHEELPDYYAAADVCVVPSYHESFGLAALEAMACGTPVIASRVGSLRSLVLDGRTGCLVEGHDPETFARCLEELLGDSELRRQLGRAAREWAQEFPWSRTAEGVLAAYQQALSSGSARPVVAPCSG